jgi:hypothetical protein
MHPHGRTIIIIMTTITISSSVRFSFLTSYPLLQKLEEAYFTRKTTHNSLNHKAGRNDSPRNRSEPNYSHRLYDNPCEQAHRSHSHGWAAVFRGGRGVPSPKKAYFFKQIWPLLPFLGFLTPRLVSFLRDAPPPWSAFCCAKEKTSWFGSCGFSYPLFWWSWRSVAMGSDRRGREDDA